MSVCVLHGSSKVVRLREATRQERSYMGAVNRNVTAINRLDVEEAKRVLALLKQARSRINAALMDTTEFGAFYLSRMKADVERIMREFQAEYTSELGRAQIKVEAMGTAMVAEPLARVGIAVSFSALPSAITQTLAAFHADQIKGITFEAIEKITNELSLGLLSGSSKEQVIKAISKYLPGPAGAGTIGNRASRIIRTEVNRIHSITTQTRLEQAAQVVRGLRKWWLTAEDDRVRPTHERAGVDYDEANAIPFDEPFIVGGFRAMYPRDPALPAGEVVNCRCRHVPKPPEVEG